METSKPTLRFRGAGQRLRLRVATSPDPLANIRECCRASVAVDKALGEAVRDALNAGRSWAEVGHALGVEGSTSAMVTEQYAAARRWMWPRFWGLAGEA